MSARPTLDSGMRKDYLQKARPNLVSAATELPCVL
jgi:hypothetical protein